jgi:hypothetical protein
MAITQIGTIVAVAVIALVMGFLGSQLLKALGVLWSKTGGIAVGIIVAIVALLAITAFTTKCVEKCEVYGATIGPIFATPAPSPTVTPVIVVVTATPTQDPKNVCVVVSGQGLACRGLP